MEFICANCGNNFESDQEEPRCPGCLRKHTVIKSEDSEADSSPWGIRKIIIFCVGLAILIGGSVVLYKHLHKNQISGNNEIVDAKTLLQKISKKFNIKLSPSESPFATAKLEEISSLKNKNELLNFIEKQVIPKISWQLPQNIFSPPQIKSKLQKDEKLRFSPLEWALLLYQSLKNTPLEVEICEFKGVEENIIAYPLEMGNYCLAAKNNNGQKKKIYPLLPLKNKGKITAVEILTPSQILARWLALKGISFLKPPSRLVRLIKTPAPKEVSTEHSQKVLNYLKAALNLEPKSEEVLSAYFWAYLDLKIYKEAGRWLQKLDAVSTHGGTRELKAFFYTFKSDFQLAAKTLESTSLPYLPLKRYLKLVLGQKTECQTQLVDKREFSVYVNALSCLKENKSSPLQLN